MPNFTPCFVLCALVCSVFNPLTVAAQEAHAMHANNNVEKNAAGDSAASSEVLRNALASLDTDLEKIRLDWKVPGFAIAITKDEKIIYAKGFGLRDVAHNLPMTPDTLLAIGSTTKAFTTAAIAQQVEAGKLDWNQPVRNYFPTFKLQDPVASEHTTPLDLITHRTGLPRHDSVWYNAQMSRAELVRRMQFLEPSKDFRAEIQYNNIAYAAAGYLIEVVSGKSWEKNVKDKIFLPLGMKRANFSIVQMQKDSNFSQPYRVEVDGQVTQLPFRDISIIGPAGSINASVNEMAAWTIFHLNDGHYQGKEILSKKSIDFLHTPKMPLGLQITPEVVPVGYAAGWSVAVYRGHLRLHHAGAIDGFTSMVALLPNAGIGITILTNQERHDVPDVLERTTIDRLLGLEKRDWSGESFKKSGHAMMMEGMAEDDKPKTGTHPAHPLADYAGVYEHPAYGEVTVRHQDGQLFYQLNRIETPLEHWNFDTFNGLKAKDPSNENMKVRFETDNKGEISTLAIGLEPDVKPIVFGRKKAGKNSS